MRPFWFLSDMAQAKLFLHRISIKPPKTLLISIPNLSRTTPDRLAGDFFHQTRCFCTTSDIVVAPKRNVLFTEKPDVESSREGGEEEGMNAKVAELEHELVGNGGFDYDAAELAEIFEAKDAADLLRRFPDGSALIELLNRLTHWPQLALEVFNWRRKQVDAGIPMVSEEYSKGIALAGRVKDVALAVKLFLEADSAGVRSSSTYNALMAAYMYNSQNDKARSLFEDLKRDAICSPTIVTYNILLSIYGRSVMVSHMEQVLQGIMKLNLSFNLSTYNILIAAYVTAWNWDDMENTYRIMKSGPIKPDIDTHLLMLRGYALSLNLENMEKTYELVKDEVMKRGLPLIRAMICAYSKSSRTDRVKKMEELLGLLPKDEYRPWLNVLMIRVYAQEDLMEGMESSICRALERNTLVTTVGVMRSIIASYFRHDAVDDLAIFVLKAESAGWRLCRSLYHCKMVMYGSQNRMEEMEHVLDEMKISKFNLTKKTFLIMYKAYSKFGNRAKVERLLGTMCKHGFEIPLDASPS